MNYPKNLLVGYCYHCKKKTNFRAKTRRYLEHPFVDIFLMIASIGFWFFFTDIKQETLKQCLECKRWGNNSFGSLWPKEELEKHKKSKIINSYPISKSKN